MASLRDGFIRMVGLDKVLRQELAKRAQTGGIASQFAASDDIVGELATIEEALSQFNMITRMHRERRMRYRDYDAMDNYGDVSVALDIYAEEATQTDLIKDTNLWATSPDKRVREIIEQFFKKQRIHTMVTGFARNLAKYGDMFLRVDYDYEGVSRILYLPPEYVHRIGPSVDLVKHYKLEHQLAKVSPRKDGILLPWECIHFRLLSFGFSTLYGRALIEPARKRWLHLKLLEDSVAIYRLNRAVERIIYYIDVGSASPQEALRIVNQYKRRFGNKRSYIDPSNSTFEQQYDPHNMLENYYWPINSGTERSRIEKLPPPPEQGQLQDLDHFNNKLYVALGIPHDYMTGEVSGAWNSREALALQDVRFSRKLHNLQISLLEGIEQLTRFHIAIVTGDADYAKNVEFQLHLADISKIARQQYDQIMINRMQLLTMMNDLGIAMNFNRDAWLKWTLDQFFPDLPKEMIDKFLIPDAALSAANQDMMQQMQPAQQEQPPQQTATKKAKGTSAAGGKKSSAQQQEDFRKFVLNDLLNRDLNEDLEPALLTELVQGAENMVLYPPVVTLKTGRPIPKMYLQKLIDEHSRPKAQQAQTLIEQS